jgi:Holliday junction resolvase
MSRLSRQKGKLGERQWRDELRAAGYTARRGQQFAGGADSPDVICEQLACVHFEVKIGKAPPVYPAMVQALRDARGKLPIVATRKDRERDFLVTMQSAAFFALLRDGLEGLQGLNRIKETISQTTETEPAQRQLTTGPASLTEREV